MLTRVQVAVLQTCALPLLLPTEWWLLAVVGEPVVGLAGQEDLEAGLSPPQEPVDHQTARPAAGEHKSREAPSDLVFQAETELLDFSASGVVGEPVRLLAVEAVAEVSSVAVAEVPIAFREETMELEAGADPVTHPWR
jgi:hypothetical protein